MSIVSKSVTINVIADHRHQIVDLFFMILLILFFGWLVISTLSTINFAGSRDQNRTALGELTQGVIVQQQVPVKRIRFANLVCYEVLFATYRRSNWSFLQISLIQDNYRETITINASKLIDNRSYPLCFQATGFSEGKAYLEIAGLNGRAGNSPTVWMTSDISHGGVIHNGNLIQKSLIFDAYAKRNNVLYLTGIGIFSVFIVVIIIRLGKQNTVFRINIFSQLDRIKENKLFSFLKSITNYQCLIIVFSITALMLAFAMAKVSKLSAHPDEHLHAAAGAYYQMHHWPPVVGDPKANFTYSANYGVSYINQSGIEYFLIGKFSSLINLIIPNSKFYSLRTFNLFLMFLLFLLIWQSENRLVFSPIIITPQVWYVASYTNNDFFPFFIMMILCYEFLDKRSFYNRSLISNHIGFAIPIGILLGILLISKSNYLVFFLFSIGYLFWNSFKHNQFQMNRGFFSSRVFNVSLLILLCALSVYTVRTGFDIYQNGFNKNQLLKSYANQFAQVGFRPIDIQNNIQNTHNTLRLKAKGESLHGLIIKRDWHGISMNSFFGVYGKMNIKAKKTYYQFIALLGGLLITYISIQYFITFKPENYIFLGIVWLFMSTMIFVSLYHSWTYDFQPQGRYLFPMLGILSFLIHEAWEYLNQRLLGLIISLMFVFSFWSFLFIGLNYILQ